MKMRRVEMLQSIKDQSGATIRVTWVNDQSILASLTGLTASPSLFKLIWERSLYLRLNNLVGAKRLLQLLVTSVDENQIC